MQPQGLPFNKSHIDALVARINAVTDCSELQQLVNEVFAMLQAEIDGINTQLGLLQPMLDLIKAPTSLSAIISWISNFITAFILPVVKPAMLYVQQITALVAAIAELQAAIQQAADNIKTCSVSIPQVTPPVLPELPQLPEIPPVQV